MKCRGNGISCRKVGTTLTMYKDYSQREKTDDGVGPGDRLSSVLQNKFITLEHVVVKFCPLGNILLPVYFHPRSSEYHMV